MADTPKTADAAAQAGKTWAKIVSYTASAIAAITKTPGKTAGFAAGTAAMTGLVAALWPNKTRETPQSDGTTVSENKSGFLKKTTVALGSVLTLGMAIQAFRPNALGMKDWAERVSRGVPSGPGLN